MFLITLSMQWRQARTCGYWWRCCMWNTQIMRAGEGEHIFLRLTKGSCGNRLATTKTSSLTNFLLAWSMSVHDPFPPPCKIDLWLCARIFYIAWSPTCTPSPRETIMARPSVRLGRFRYTTPPLASTIQHTTKGPPYLVDFLDGTTKFLT
jgi:hypothetical protein